MRYILIALALAILSGCAATPVKRNFPDVPKELMESCPDLKKTEPTEKLTEVLKVVVDNYGQYHECRIKADTWIEWYKTQKHIFNSVE